MGRPPEFDRDQVISIATDLFWERGYRGVSITDVVKATGLLPGSLYASFGNKEGLFIACLRHYGQASACHIPPESTTKTPLERLESMVMSIVDESAKDPDRRGCFVINALLEIAPQVPAVLAVVREIIESNESWLHDRLEEAKESGDLDLELNSNEMASCIMGIISTSRIMARAGKPGKRIRGVARNMYRAMIEPHRLEMRV